MSKSAFPTLPVQANNGFPEPGMTLREYAAIKIAAAMFQGMLSANRNYDYRTINSAAILNADDLLNQLETK